MASAGSRHAHRAGSLVWVRRAWMTAVSSGPRSVTAARSEPMSGGCPSR